MMKNYHPNVPKGKARQRLASEGRMLNMKVTRSMNGRAVHDKILQGFKVSKYTILECDSSGHEVMFLYLCEEFQVCTSCVI